MHFPDSGLLGPAGVSLIYVTFPLERRHNALSSPFAGDEDGKDAEEVVEQSLPALHLGRAPLSGRHSPLAVSEATLHHTSVNWQMQPGSEMVILLPNVRKL